MTLMPFSRSQSIPPWKFTDSPTTTVPLPNWRINPLQYQQGASVVAMILSRCVLWRPALRNASVSACAEGSPSCTRRLWPLPRSAPSGLKRAAPMGIPPSARPARASARAVCNIFSNSSRYLLVSALTGGVFSFDASSFRSLSLEKNTQKYEVRRPVENRYTSRENYEQVRRSRPPRTAKQRVLKRIIHVEVGRKKSRKDEQYSRNRGLQCQGP